MFSILSKIFPKFIDNCNIFPSEKYLDYEKNNKDKLEYYTIYNIMYKLSVRKPFNDSDSEPFGKLLQILKAESPKLRYVLAKNYVDYLQKWAVEFQNMKDEKTEKLLKTIAKKYPRQEANVTLEILPMMNQYNQIAYKLKLLHLINSE